MTQNADSEVVIPIVPRTAEFDEWVHSVRVLVSQIGFALDNYLASRPSPPNGSSSAS